MSSKKLVNILLHVLFTALVVIVPVFLMPLKDSAHPDFLNIARIVFTLLQSTAFYFNAYVLYPRFLLRKKVVSYILSVIGICAAIAAIPVHASTQPVTTTVYAAHYIVSFFIGLFVMGTATCYRFIFDVIKSQHLQQVDAEAGTNSNRSRLHYLLHYIHENITEKILIDTLCRKAYLGRNAFFKLFREQFGVSPLEYINNERIKMAKQLLADTAGNITEISRQCGFTDVNYFVRLFKKAEGITPGSWQQCLRRQKQAL